ncbi:alkaline phosphatase family protein [Vibrio ruber]|uniref:alkaline phosphatase family protein n=1 Tax=Vibrio ruber TaxID=184755 RepID=UPI00289335F3|nr:alkaline phosphatase family protein [Vibrio ruber]WNJ97290.1 alkaline phosphatase family protein [Vibrio ruber]
MSISVPDSIYCCRERLRQCLENNTHTIVLAIDGIHLDIARQCWPEAKTEQLETVFPTTSSTGWLSSLTGQTIHQHRVPGVVFRPTSNAPLINVWEYDGDEIPIPEHNIFTDAIMLGYQTVAINGDFLPVTGRWTQALFAHCQKTCPERFFTAPALDIPQKVHHVTTCIDSFLNTSEPTFIWCFIDTDLHIHRYGYDQDLCDFLTQLGKQAEQWQTQGYQVIAYSDHGLVPTRHDIDIANTIEKIADNFNLQTGGAGRTRWLYTSSEQENEIIDTLRQALPTEIQVISQRQIFTQFDPRIGRVLIIAGGENFICPAEYIYEHGSRLPEEMQVPFTYWRPYGR